MKPIKKHFLATLIIIVAGAGLCSCVGYVDGGGGYGRGWHDDGPWFGGPRGYVGVGVHPFRR